MYGIPKLNKCKKISIACRTTTDILVKTPNDLKLRHMIAGPVCEIYHLSNVLDTLVKENLYRQKSGTVITTRIAFLFINLFIISLKVTLHHKIHEKFVDPFSHLKENSWKRYLDAYFIPWLAVKERF